MQSDDSAREFLSTEDHAATTDDDLPDIENYKLLQLIGKGGMGRVYMAEQMAPIKRRVALKVIKSDVPSKEIMVRFEAERQALAMMDHQNIARVLDAGVNKDGVPFFAMELVNGIPITIYCDQHKLSLVERLPLFIQTCRAVQHAHQKGIIHRDIKPSNILVAMYDGNPIVKVIDFGLAKALHSHTALTDKTMFTRYGQVVGTLEYMSPEQAQMNALDIDTRSDVYSLGVLLYELLTGSTPIGRERLQSKAFDQILLLIRKEEASRPSERLSSTGDAITTISERRKTDPKGLSSMLRGDLDWIAIKALEKDRTRRYGGAAEFGDDVQRYLDNEAIEARPPSFGYQLQKAYVKHKASFLTAVAVVALLVGGLAGTGTMWYRADRLAGENAILAEEKSAETKNVQQALQRALSAESELERTLARSNYFLATSSWDDHRAGDAMDYLMRVPEEHRHVEWELALQEFTGSTVTCFRDRHPSAPVHYSTVHCIAISPSADQFITGHADGKCQVWDARSCEPLRQFDAHEAPVCAVEFSPDGTAIATAGSYDDSVALWDIATGEEVFRLTEGVDRAYQVKFSPDGSLVAVANGDNKTAQLWETDSGQLVKTFTFEQIGMKEVAFSPNGKTLAIGVEAFGGHGVIELYDLAGDSEPIVMKRSAQTLAFNQDGTRLVSGGWKGALTVWDPSDGTLLWDNHDNQDHVSSVAFHPNGKIFASGSYDNTVRLFDMDSQKQHVVLRGHVGPVESIRFCPGGEWLASTSQDSAIKFWDWQQNGVGELEGSAKYTQVNFDPQENYFVANGGNSIAVWDIRTRASVPELSRRGSTREVTFIEDGAALLALRPDQSILRWDMNLERSQSKTSESKSRWASEISFQPNRPTFSPNGRLLATIGHEYEDVEIWDMRTGQRVHVLEGHTGYVLQIRFSHGGKLLFTGSQDKTVKVWDVDSGGLLHTLPSGQFLWALAITHDAKVVALAVNGPTQPGKIVLLDVLSGDVIGNLTGHTQTISQMSFAPSGDRLLSTGSEGVAILWDVESHEMLRRIPGNWSAMRALFSPTGKHIAIMDETIRLLHVDQGAPVLSVARTYDSHWAFALPNPEKCFVQRPYAEYQMAWSLSQ